MGFGSNTARNKYVISTAPALAASFEFFRFSHSQNANGSSPMWCTGGCTPTSTRLARQRFTWPSRGELREGGVVLTSVHPPPHSIMASDGRGRGGGGGGSMLDITCDVTYICIFLLLVPYGILYNDSPFNK